MNKIKKMFFRKSETKSKSRSILIIDDDIRNRKFLSAVVRKKYNNILWEKDIKSGYYTVEDKQPNLIIISAVISGERSLGLCRKLKDNPRTKLIPILILADSQENIKSIEYYDKGVDYFITSPISEGDLLKQIEILIGK